MKYEKQSGDQELRKWGGLFRAVAYSTVAMLALIPVQIAIFAIAPPPETAEGFFALFARSSLLGLASMDALYIVNNVLVAIMYLGFYISLRRQNESVMAIAMLLGFLGISSYFASNGAFEMLSLSQAYATAGEAERIAILGAGRAVLAAWQGTAFDVYYVLNGVALILIAVVMRSSSLYGKKIARIGLVSGFLMMVPSTAGSVGLVFSLASLVPWIAFSIAALGVFRRLADFRQVADI